MQVSDRKGLLSTVRIDFTLCCSSSPHRALCAGGDAGSTCQARCRNKCSARSRLSRVAQRAQHGCPTVNVQACSLGCVSLVPTLRLAGLQVGGQAGPDVQAPARGGRGVDGAWGVGQRVGHSGPPAPRVLVVVGVARGSEEVAHAVAVRCAAAGAGGSGRQRRLAAEVTAH